MADHSLRLKQMIKLGTFLVEAALNGCAVWREFAAEGGAAPRSRRASGCAGAPRRPSGHPSPKAGRSKRAHERRNPTGRCTSRHENANDPPSGRSSARHFGTSSISSDDVLPPAFFHARPVHGRCALTRTLWDTRLDWHATAPSEQRLHEQRDH
jgi:hypothetical protein